MAQKSHTAHLFNESACLKLEALQDYSLGRLTSAEAAAVKNHLSSCILCSEALEGLAMIDDQQHLHETIGSLKEQITEHAHARPQIRLRHIQARFSRRIWIYSAAAAACIIILIGFFSLYFRLQNTSKDNLSALNDSIQVSDNKMSPESIPPVTSETQISGSAGRDALAMNSPEKEKGAVGPVKTVTPVPEMAENEQDKSNDGAAINQQEPATVGEESEMIVAGVAVVQPSESVRISSAEMDTRITDSALVLDMQIPLQSGIMKRTGNAVAEMEEPESKMILADTSTQYDKLGRKIEKPYVVVEQEPLFPGGNEAFYTYLKDSLRYPQEAIKQHIEGTVYISLVVNEDGSLSDIVILRGLDTCCDNEAIRFVKSMPAWIPGMNDGKKVKVRYNLPIRFDLP